MAHANPQHVVRTYGNWNRPRSVGLARLEVAPTVVLFAGLLLAVMVSFTRDLFSAAVVLGVTAAVTWLFSAKDVHGRSVIARQGSRVAWWSSRSSGGNLYRSGPVGQAPWGTYQLPGLAAAMTLSEHEDAYGRPFAMIHTPATSSFTVVFGTWPDGASLVDPDTVDMWVSDWGRWLAQLSDEANVIAASVTIETSPETGWRLRQEVETGLDPSAPQFALDVMREIVDTYPAGSSEVRAYVAVTFSGALAGGTKTRSAEDVGNEIAARLPGLTQTLQLTGAGTATPVAAQELCEFVRVAYDPAVGPWIEQSRAQGEVPVLRWTDVGPSAHEASWDGYRHDSGKSYTWAMSRAPQGNVTSGILDRLLAPHPDVARKRVTLLYQPIPTARAAALVDADVTRALNRAANATRTGRAPAREAREVQNAEATAREEAAGAGLVEFGMLVTATVMDGSATEARAAIHNMSAASRVLLRPVFGSQDSAFAACLPLGIMLPKHVSIPAAVRGAL